MGKLPKDYIPTCVSHSKTVPETGKSKNPCLFEEF
jgi:hypothetical protein